MKVVPFFDVGDFGGVRSSKPLIAFARLKEGFDLSFSGFKPHYSFLRLGTPGDDFRKVFFY